eukprot:8176950-Ditylum_brightwellii.AAC.1
MMTAAVTMMRVMKKILGTLTKIVEALTKREKNNDSSKHWLVVERAVSKLHARLESEREIQMKVDKF